MIIAVKRLYFFELFAVANLALVGAFAHASLPIVGSPIRYLLAFSVGISTQALGAIVVRLVISLVRRDRSYWDLIRTRQWIVDTVRLILGGALVVVVYGWVKLVVPIYHPRLFDAELWDVDRALLFGIPPTTFMLDVFRAPWFLRVIDWSYSNIFLVSATIAFAWALSHPERRIRIGFANGNALLWISGAWLYLLLPSLGPAFRFPDVWLAHEDVLRRTQSLQAILMRNYQNVLRAAHGQTITEPIRIVFGIGAFPSLHVAFQCYVYFWMRRVWRAGQMLFGVFAFTIFLGSMITGWHYLIDAIAGVGMAYLAYRLCFPNHADDAGTNDAGRGAGGADGASSAGAD